MPDSLGPEPLPETLIEQVLTGDASAWQELLRQLEPRLYGSFRRPGRLGRLAQSEDHCRNMVVDVMEALQEDAHARLKQFTQARRDNPALSFWGWLDVVARRRAIDYMRRQREFTDRRREENASQKGGWKVIVPVASDSKLPGVRPPITDLGTARELLSYAGHVLAPPQRAALEAWIAGATFDEIATSLALPDARGAEKVVRAALQRMRRRFKTAK